MSRGAPDILWMRPQVAEGATLKSYRVAEHAYHLDYGSDITRAVV